MGVKIREATKQDFNAIVELSAKLADYHHTIDKYYLPGGKAKKRFANYLSEIMSTKDVKILVAEVDDKLVGYFIGKIDKAKAFADASKIGKISDAFVDEKYRRKGIARQMFNKLLEWFKKNDVSYIELSVDSRNEIGIKTWQSFGFKEFMKKMRFELYS